MSDPRADTGILIVRAWIEGEPASLRARLTRVVEGRERPVITTASVDEACEVVRRWLLEVARHRDSSDNGSRCV